MELAPTVFWAPLGRSGRLVWQNDSLQCRRPGPVVAIASSRLPCSIEHWDSARILADWFCAVRCQLMAIRSRCESLLVIDGTTGAAFLRTVAVELGIPVTRGCVVSKWQAWHSRDKASFPRHQLVVSPALHALSHGKGRHEFEATNCNVNTSRLAIRDQALWVLADRLAVLHARHGGGWTEQLRAYRAVNTRWQPGTVDYDHTLNPAHAHPSHPSHPFVTDRPVEFVAHRRCSRRVSAAPAPSLANSHTQQTRSTQAFTVDVTPPIWDRTPVLTHWTRSRSGPWPGETFAAYCLQLLFGWPEDRSAIASLSRIMRQRTIQATSDRIRSQDAVVCFSAKPPMEMAPIYRRHLRRFDSTGFGLVIDRCWLARIGARPVTYGDDSAWRRLPTALRPFFQPVGRHEQWRDEQEWRLVGNLSLDAVPRHGIEVVTPRPEDGALLEQWSPWPVRCISAS